MRNHTPADYVCLFCCLVQNIECDQNELQQSDIVPQNENVTAFMAMRRFPNNPGHVLVIPNQHYENIYDLPLEIAIHIHACARKVALAMKNAYGCDGILIRQHNEPAGGQNVFHYHMHVIPRYTGDDFDFRQKQPFPIVERTKYAQRLRDLINTRG
jgi:histidine triad (HIT) family protein